MFHIKRILFPVDFSVRSKGAAAYAESFAGRFDAELILLHVIEPVTYNSLLANLEIQKEAFDKFLGDGLKHLRVERIIARGEAARTIVECAESRKVDLIMLPTQGQGIFRRLLLGSTAAKVLHDAECAVWTAVHMESAPKLEAISLRRIVCAVNLGASSGRVLHWAQHVAEEYQAELTLVHVASNGGSASARASLERLQNRLGVAAALRVEEGEPSKALASLAEQLQADLLVIGRKGLPGIRGRLEMTAYSIIRESPCPVVSV